MAEGADPDDRGSHKNESILRWLKDVKMASQDVPRVSDRGLISNPAQTSYFAHDPIGVDAAVYTTDPNQSPFSHAKPHPITSSYVHRPLESPQHSFHKVHLPTRRTQSFSLLSRPLPTASLYRRQPTHKPKTSPISKPSPRTQTASGSHSAGFAESDNTTDHTEPEKETEIVSTEEKKEVEASDVDNKLSTSVQATSRHSGSEETSESRDAVDLPGPKKGGGEETLKEERKEEVIGGACDQRLQKLRSFTKTRQSSLSPLPVPMMQPSLPTFNPSDVGILPAKHNRLALTKKMPTITGVKPGRTGVLSSASKLLRATTSPSKLSLTKTKSAPTSPKPLNKESSHERRGSEISEEKEEKKGSVMLPGVLERRKSFSHDDVIQLQQLGQLSVGQVSPVASCDLSNGDAPSTQHSLVVEGGSSSEDDGDDSIGKLDSLPSDEVPVHIRDSSEDSPSHQSASSVDADRGMSDSADPATTNYHSRPGYLFTEHPGDQSKVLATSVCPISPPSPRTPHSPLVRQHHISRSPSPSFTHTSSVSPFHKSRRSGSSPGTESDNVISKQKLKLHEEGQTFSFDTSDDGDLPKLSRQPKFLLKKSFQPMSSCPLSPPSPSSSHHSSGILSQYLSRHHHYTHSDNASLHSLHISSPTKLGDVPTKQTGHASNTSSRSRSPVLSDQLFLRRGSTPVTLSLMKTTSQGGSLSAKSSYLASARSSFQSAVPAVRTVTKPPPGTAVKVLSPTKYGDGSKEHPSREHGLGEISLKVHNQGDSEATEKVKSSGGLDKGPVNRQDSGIGTLSTTSNKCDFRM